MKVIIAIVIVLLFSQCIFAMIIQSEGIDNNYNKELYGGSDEYIIERELFWKGVLPVIVFIIGLKYGWWYI